MREMNERDRDYQWANQFREDEPRGYRCPSDPRTRDQYESTIARGDERFAREPVAPPPRPEPTGWGQERSRLEPRERNTTAG